MKEEMAYCVAHPEEIDKIAKVKAQVDEVKGVMMGNIEKVSYFIIRLFLIKTFSSIFYKKLLHLV